MIGGGGAKKELLFTLYAEGVKRIRGSLLARKCHFLSFHIHKVRFKLGNLLSS